jgi:probable rRNA maturation factor
MGKAGQSGVRFEICCTVRSMPDAAAVLPRVAAYVARAEGFRRGHVSIAVIGEKQMARVHERHLGARGSTDVLTFDLGTDRRRRELFGEIIVCADVARRAAARQGRSRRGAGRAFTVPALHAQCGTAVSAARRSQQREAQVECSRSSGTPTAELALYLTHGILHLAGYDDSTPRGFDRMHTREDELLTQLGIGAVFSRRRRRRHSRSRL